MLRAYTLRMSVAYTWNSTVDERAAAYACDGMLDRTDAALFRALTIEAPVAVVFRWLCQLRTAPYSYDWIDNLGRTSPEELTPGLEQLAVGQPIVTIFDLVSFEKDRQITLKLRPRRVSRALFGDLTVTYAVSTESEATRLIAKLAVRYPSRPIGWVMRLLLPCGDLVMMRKQFLNLKRLSERDAKRCERPQVPRPSATR